MGEPVKLETRTATPKQGVIEVCEYLLAKAKSGELQAIAAAQLDSDGSVTRSIVRSDRTPALIGAVAWMQKDLIESWDRE